jgi:hypothetical protein
MVNPSAMQQLAKEYQREILEAGRTRRRAVDAAGPGVRERLGWTLIGLGVHLALDGRRHMGSWHRVPDRRPLRAPGALHGRGGRWEPV